ncbi:UPF0658 Golgi apparatus membrane protein [Teratosphaeria destructans]|uniref:UPF0658 Golgi apparatus membrane protein n=1 Tax=Teratosphaeria destructans TaxID=418781 RepID=A0A9W7VYI0_9PEZI|nr:UPF0658 Golgi apparatus membrane protein [Teratosphaeria destructans]
MFYDWYNLTWLGARLPFQSSWEAPLVIAQVIAVIVESVYQFVLSLHTAKRRNIVQVLAICANNFCMLAFTALAWCTIQWDFDAEDFDARNNDRGIYYIAVRRAFILLVALLGLVTVALSVMAWRLYREFSWAIYRFIAAADRKLRRLYLTYEIYVALLHLDFFFLFGFWVQAVIPLAITCFDNGQYDPNLSLAALALAFTIPQLILAAISVRKEWRVGQAITLVMYLVYIGVVSYQIWFVWTQTMNDGDQERYAELLLRMQCYGGIVLVLLVASTIMSGICMRNFNGGLLLHNRRDNDGAVEETQSRWTYYQSSDGQFSLERSRRMVMD